jgi:hypothetical protein
MRRILRYVLILSALFSGAIVTARAAGRQNTLPPLAATYNAGECPQPCFRGIRLGITTLAEANALIRADSSLNLIESNAQHVCWTRSFITSQDGGCALTYAGNVNAPIDEITISLPEGALKLGHLIQALGQPIGIDKCGNLISPYLIFQGGTLVWFHDIWRTGERYDPNLSVGGIIYRRLYPGEEIVRAQWRGFTQVNSAACGD